MTSPTTPGAGLIERVTKREAIARIIDPWTFNQLKWAGEQDDDAVLRHFLPLSEQALAKADAILAALTALEQSEQVKP